MVARAYIRHPSDMPIELDNIASSDHLCSFTKDISCGGLSFQTQRPFDNGAIVMVKIPVIQPAFEARAKVVWCLAASDGYEVGVEFCDSVDAYRARMVEQICHIEHYKLWLKEVEGREIDSEHAAMEWIDKFAEDFPALS